MSRRTIRDVLEKSPFVLNGYITMPGAFSAELYARQGWDAVTIDLQHGLIDYNDAVSILQAVSATGVVPLARVSWLDPGPIMKILDAGILGITCPMVSTAEDARRLVSYTRYPPVGIRSMGPIRAALLDGPDYAKNANRSVNVFAMVETQQGIDNIEEIVAVDGLDGIYLGLHDLALSMGKIPRADPSDPAVEKAMDRVLELCAKRGLIAGVLSPTPEGAWRLVQRGFRFITLSSDANALASRTKSWVDTFRKASASAEGP